MSARRALFGSLVAFLALISGCTSQTASAALPSGAELLGKSAEVMRSVKSTHFAITVDGELPDIPVQGAEGDLNGDGNAKGKAKTNQFGQLLEVDFVLVDKNLYVKGATGGFTKLPAFLAGQVYEPTVVLNPDKGVAHVLASVKDPKTTGDDGDTYEVTGTVPKDVAAGLVPGIGSDVAGRFFVAKDSSQLRTARFELPGKNGGQAAVEVVLSDLGKPVTVNAPA
jgi:lipoprotein LprG